MSALGRLGAVILSLLLLWQGILWMTALPPFILPSPARVAAAFWDSRALIFEHALVTLTEIALGFGIGASLGALTAITLAFSRRMRMFVSPLLVFSQALPVFALAPILTLWLGYGLGSKVAMAVLIIFFPVTSSFLDGLLRTPAGYLDLARTMGASRLRVMLHIRIPAALPALLSGLKLGAVYAPIGAVIGEWVGSSQGLGYLMLLANGRAKTDLMFAAMLTLGVMSILIYLLADLLTRKLARH
jgi:putative hydroxymethylpyrimidine transport system permease protein